MFPNDETRFLTKELNVTYAVPEDNTRKANSVDKYKKMAQRNGKLFSHQPFKWLMKRAWGRKLLFTFFGRKKDKKSGWPAWVTKTDEERVQNMPWILNDKEPWIATEKIDGTSTTFTLKRGKWPTKEEFYICSRNVVFDKPDKKCFYETNVYTEMAEKYHIYDIMKKLLETKFTDCEWITIQGETYGPGIQKRDYHITEHNFMAFNFITSKDGRWGTEAMTALLTPLEIPCVPIIETDFILPDTVEELLTFATNKSVLDNDLREGIVFRSKDGSKSFKAVSNEFLMKYHQ
jgi:RNA ligase (TIGR02306 family)